MQIQGSAVLITGGGRGLGAALGRHLARGGARVVLVARTEEEVASVARALREEGRDAHALAADVGERPEARRIAAVASAMVGPIDLLVHCASTLGHVPLRPLLDTESEALERALAVNVIGPFRLTRIVAAAMALRGSGLVVHVTSDAAVNAYPLWGAYGASKAAFDHLTRIWGAELGVTGVRFLSVDPGEMDTRMHVEAVPGADRSILARPDDVAVRIGGLIARAESFPNGTRIEGARLETAA